MYVQTPALTSTLVGLAGMAYFRQLEAIERTMADWDPIQLAGEMDAIIATVDPGTLGDRLVRRAFLDTTYLGADRRAAWDRYVAAHPQLVASVKEVLALPALDRPVAVV